jgi:hypothetical protein
MKKVLLVLSLIFLASCSTTKSGTSKSIDIVGPGVIHKPVIADLDVSQEKISASSTFERIKSMEAARKEVIRKALKAENADVLVEPTFESTTTGSQTDLTVQGWPAKYKNFRQVTEEDIRILEMQPHYLRKAEVSESSSTEGKRGMGWLWVIVGLVAAGVAASGAL